MLLWLNQDGLAPLMLKGNIPATRKCKNEFYNSSNYILWSLLLLWGKISDRSDPGNKEKKNCTKINKYLGKHVHIEHF